MVELARDIDAPERRDALMRALPHVEGGDALLPDPDLAWRAYACALLADELGDG